MLRIAKSAKISRFADVEDSVRGSEIVIGEHVTIDSFVKIKPAGGSGNVVIGDFTVINPGVAIYSGNGVTIGKYVMIAANCVLSATSHEFLDKDVPVMRQGFVPLSKKGRPLPGIVIEDDVWIGANCVIHEGARLRRGAVIAAGSTLKGEFEEFGIYAHNPLKCIGYRR